MGIKCPYCGKEIPSEEFAKHHAECEKRRGVTPKPKIAEEHYKSQRRSTDPRNWAEYRIQALEREITFDWAWQKGDFYEHGTCVIRLPKTKGRKALVSYWISGGEEGVEGSYGHVEKRVWVDGEWAESFYNKYLEKVAKVQDETKEVRDLLIEMVKELAEKIGGYLLEYVRSASFL